MYPRQLIENVATLEEVRDATVAPRRLNAFFIASFGALAMIIAVVGIAGVLAFSVSSRTAEIGIRMSLGATTGQVRRMILGEGGTLVVIGLVLGAMGAMTASRLMQGLLFGVAPSDPATLMFVALIMAAASIAACLVPAVRASRVDPSIALRSD
jgi:ABC-type antimicrobial peptide transport system permease subunit